MKEILLLILLLFISFSNAEDSIYNSSKETKLGCESISFYKSPSKKTEECYDELYYTASNWQSSNQIFSNSHSVVNAPPGDICSLNSECYSSKCIDGKCTANIGLVDDCSKSGDPDSLMCPENLYCDSDYLFCTERIQLGKSCDQTHPCESGLGCIGTKTVEENFEYTCKEMFKGSNGEKFRYVKNSFLSDPDSSVYCSSANSFYHFSSDVYECRPGDQSEDKTEESLKRNSISDLCTYITYNDENARFDQPITKKDAPSKGFIIDNIYYCDKRFGDTVYTLVSTSIFRSGDKSSSPPFELSFGGDKLCVISDARSLVC